MKKRVFLQFIFNVITIYFLFIQIINNLKEPNVDNTLKTDIMEPIIEQQPKVVKISMV